MHKGRMGTVRSIDDHAGVADDDCVCCVISLSQPSGAGGRGTRDIESDDRHKYSRGFHH